MRFYCIYNSVTITSSKNSANPVTHYAALFNEREQAEDFASGLIKAGQHHAVVGEFKVMTKISLAKPPIILTPVAFT